MKIAFVIDDSLDRPDGVQQYVLTLGAWLTSEGHDVHYICSDTTREDLPNVHSLASNRAVSFNSNALRIPMPVSPALLREFMGRHRFDVVHVQTPHSPLFGARVVDAARAVQGDDVRIVGTFLILPDGAFSAAATRALGILLRRNLERFDSFIAISQPAVEFARQAFGIEAKLIAAGVDTEQFSQVHMRQSRTKDSTLTVSFLGRFVERKGALELIEALALLPNEVRGRITVRMGGRGPLLGAAEQALKAHGLADIVTLEGFVSEEDKPQFFADADIAVFPSTGGESFGIVLIEAMAAGAGVVLGGDNPGYVSVLGDAERFAVNPRDTQEFADRLAELIVDGPQRKQLGAHQAEQVKSFDIATVGRQVLSVYRSRA